MIQPENTLTLAIKMFRNVAKYLGSPLVITSLLTPIAYCKDSECKLDKAKELYNEPPRIAKTIPEDATELERCIHKCREEIKPIKENVMGFVDTAGQYARTSVDFVDRNVKYLRTAPQEVQIGAIAAGTLLGSLFGIRRGIFKKVLFGTIGGVTTAAAIYPEESYAIAKETLSEAKMYSIIAYRFITGPNSSDKKDSTPPLQKTKEEEYCDCPPEGKKTD